MRRGQGCGAGQGTTQESVRIIKISDVSARTKRTAVEMVKSGWILNFIVQIKPSRFLAGKGRGRFEPNIFGLSN